MSAWITTYTGEHFYPTRPEMDKIVIQDIAHALSLICRGNGQLKTFYSVGQHCIACAREAEAEGLSPRVKLAALLHDAGECYMSDVPRPFKQELPRYQAWENHLLNFIYTKFLGAPLTRAEKAEVRRIDNAMLYYDLDDLLEDQEGEEPRVLIKPDHSFRAFEEVEEEYLKLYIRLYAEYLSTQPDEEEPLVKGRHMRRRKG